MKKRFKRAALLMTMLITLLQAVAIGQQESNQQIHRLKAIANASSNKPKAPGPKNAGRQENAGETQKECSVCELPKPAFIVDASTGETYWYDTGDSIPDKTNKKIRFGKTEEISVVIINKNPFLFKYNITIQGTPIVEDAIIPFLKAFSPVFSTLPADLAPLTALTALTVSPKTVAIAGCPAVAGDRYEFLMKELDKLNDLRKDTYGNEDRSWGALKKNLVNYSTAYNTVSKVLEKREAKSTSSNSEAALCKEICLAANTFLKAVAVANLDGEKGRFADAKKALEDLKDKAELLLIRLKDFMSTFPTCNPKLAGDPVLPVAAYQVQAMISEVVQKLSELNKLQEEYKATGKLRDSIVALSTHLELLQEVRKVGPYNVATNVVVKLEYKSIDAKDSDPFRQISEVKLNFGGDKIFALSGGGVAGFLERPEFKPILGFERDKQGNILPNQLTTKTIVGLTDDAKHRFTPIVMLSARLTNYPKTNLFFSVGITGTSDNTGANIEYLLGPSINFWERRLFFTYGLYAGRVQQLNPDLYLGLGIADGVTADKLIKKTFTLRSGFALTYRIR